MTPFLNMVVFYNYSFSIQNNLDKGLLTAGVFVDLQKAFDTVDHNILLHKLMHYGIKGSSLDWFKSYFTGRKQFFCSHKLSLREFKFSQR